ncbi:hypothetical protein KPH14_013105 [Odynerus spinipes]|uniref:MSV199 domain-containing protein n=1 Tax=Odynerus spinipes TaxID=1348599 RepID=A0AAD9R7U4_9HYME|nr:hypothetical protein KPH14_013105 [Odynerus spinipes]
MDSTNKLITKEEIDEIPPWITETKLSIVEIYSKFGIDLLNDKRNVFILQLLTCDKIVINDDVLTYCGYSGRYKNQKNNFLQLLKKNDQISFDQITDMKNTRKHYVLMNTADLKFLLPRMRSDESYEISNLLDYFKLVYRTYEKLFGRNRCRLLNEEYDRQLEYTNELKHLVLQIKDYARQKIDHERKLHMETKEKMTRVRLEVIEPLATKVSPMVAPDPISTKKERCLGLINIEPNYTWYIVRRQRETFNIAISKILRKYKDTNPTVLKKWYKISHAIDIGNSLKLRLRNLSWSARGNILSVIDRDNGPCYTNELLIRETDTILQDNIAMKLYNKAKEIIT